MGFAPNDSARDFDATTSAAAPSENGLALPAVTVPLFLNAGLSFAISGCQPEIMGIGPVLSSRKALQRAGIGLDEVEVVELNEAFAAQALACVDELGLDLERTNLDGGAIALGHPLGATGARITGKAAALLAREGKRYALATQCIGGGQGIATVLEAI